MFKRLKRKWVEALRSGKFKQGRGYLRRVEGINDDGNEEESYCCLGVLSCVMNGVRPPMRMLLGNTQLKRAGLTPDKQYLLADMNDGSGEHFLKARSFKQIASWIDKNL
jgi:hypothetical protein